MHTVQPAGRSKITFTITESINYDVTGRRVSGILAIPRFSINGNAYMPEELQRGDGQIVPLYSDHSYKKENATDADMRPVGEMALTWDPVRQQLLFDAIISDDEFARYVAANHEKLGASLGVLPESVGRLCGKERCYNVPRGLQFVEGSITPKPSMPETRGSLVVIESIQGAGEGQDNAGCECAKHRKMLGKQGEKAGKKELFSASFDAQIATFEEDDTTGLCRITGILAVPRVNLNGSLLLPQDLAKGHGLTIPLSINHRYSFDESIPTDGYMTLRWNEDKLQLEYDAMVTSKEGIEGCRSGKYKHTSISVMFADFDYIYGFFVLKDIVRFVEGSLVENPAIPEASVVMVESINRRIAGLQNTEQIIKAALTAKFDQAGKDAKGVPYVALLHSATNTKLNFKSLMPGKDVAIVDNSLYQNSCNQPQSTIMSAAPNSQNAASNADETNQGKAAAPASSSAAPAANSGASSAAGQGSQSQGPQFASLKDVSELVGRQVDATRLLTESVAKQTEALGKLADRIPSAAKGNAGAKDYRPTATIAGASENADSMKQRLAKIRHEALAKTLRETSSTDPVVFQQNMRAALMTEAIDLTELGTAAGGYWTVDLTSIPDKISANLREVCDVKVIPQGAKEVHFTLMARPAFGALTPPTVPSDYNQTLYPIDDVVATPSLRGVKNTITDQAVHGATADFMAKLEVLMREAAEVDLDNLIITELDGITTALAGTVYGGDATSEGTVDATDTFAAKNILKAQQLLRSKGYQIMPGDTTLIIDPAQLYSLMIDTQVQNQFQYGVQPNNVAAVPMLFGSFIRVAPMPTGLGNPTTVTTYHAFLVLNQVALGLGISQELKLEAGRVVGELSTRVIASMDAAAKAKTPTGTNAKIGVVKIITS